MKLIKHSVIVLLLAWASSGCDNAKNVSNLVEPADNKLNAESQQPKIEQNHNRVLEAISFSAEPLYRREVDEEKTEKYQKLIKSVTQQESLSEDDYIALGGYYASLYQFQNAIKAYSLGIEAFPDSYKLRRFRGQRLISVRELDKAIEDLNQALVLLSKESPETDIEYSASGKPHGSYELWIWYHIGLYHYNNGEYSKAAKAYEKCIEVSPEEKYLASPIDWLYNTYQKSGDAVSAERVLGLISPDSNVDKNHPYFKRLMLYKGIVKVDEIMDLNKPVEQWTARDMTIAYGVANWYRYQGDPAKAERLHKNILKTPFWNSWAYVVTDKEYAH